MKLRAEVEQLDSSIADEKDAYKSTMKSLRMQKNDLEAIIAREDLRIKQLLVEMSKVKKEVREAGKNSVGLKPIVLEALASLEKTVQAQIPFKTEDRIADIRRIQKQVENDEVTAQKSLAEVVRVGMMMFFKIPDDTMGMLLKQIRRGYFTPPNALFYEP